MNDLEAAVRRYMDENMKPSRTIHTEGVVKTGEKLAVMYGADPQKARIAALFHDIARNMTPEELDSYVREEGLGEEFLGNPNLSHGKVAAFLMKEDFGVKDEDVLNAVAFHTTGRMGMSILEKVIYLADYIEPGRSQPGVEKIRSLAETDIDKACLEAVENTIDYLIEQGIEPDRDTLEAREYLEGITNNS